MALPRGPSGIAMLVLYSAFLAFTAALIGARVYLRLRKVPEGRLLINDWFMIAAWFSALAFAAFDVAFYVHGMLDPEVHFILDNLVVPPETVQYLLKLVWARSIPFFLTFYLCKASILAIYLQLFPVWMVKRRIALWGAIIYTGMAFVATMLTVFLVCFPLERNWAIFEPEKLCPRSTPRTVFEVGWALHFFSCIILFALPFSIIWNIQLRRRVMFATYSILFLGFVDIAFSLTRFLTIQIGSTTNRQSITWIGKYQVGAILKLRLSRGLTEICGVLDLWSALDVNVCLVIACLPALRPYLRLNTKCPDRKFSSALLGTTPRQLESSAPSRDIEDLPYSVAIHGDAGNKWSRKSPSESCFSQEELTRHAPGPGPTTGSQRNAARLAGDRRNWRSDVELIETKP